MNPMFKAMKAKKKRAVDPDAPPRPNLMTHDVKLRGQQDTIVNLSKVVIDLSEKIRSLEAKVRHQTNYLQALHSQVNKK